MQVKGDVVNESELQCSSWLLCSVKVESTEQICIKRVSFRRRNEHLEFENCQKSILLKGKPFDFGMFH